jgi:P-type Ca2+ transporter type 2C
LYSL